MELGKLEQYTAALPLLCDFSLSGFFFFFIVSTLGVGELNTETGRNVLECEGSEAF